MTEYDRYRWLLAAKAWFGAADTAPTHLRHEYIGKSWRCLLYWAAGSDYEW